VLIDVIVIKVRDAQVANRPVYVALGVSMDGERDVLGIWLGPTGGAKKRSPISATAGSRTC
jgi:putative transposase